MAAHCWLRWAILALFNWVYEPPNMIGGTSPCNKHQDRAPMDQPSNRAQIQYFCPETLRCHRRNSWPPPRGEWFMASPPQNLGASQKVTGQKLSNIHVFSGLELLRTIENSQLNPQWTRYCLDHHPKTRLFSPMKSVTNPRSHGDSTNPKGEAPTTTTLW